MSLSLIFCNRMCSLFSLSRAIQLLRTIFHAQECLPHYYLFNFGFISKVIARVLPCRRMTVSATEYFGGIEKPKWIWSMCTIPTSIKTFFYTQRSLMISRTGLPAYRFKIQSRYFGHQRMWYSHSDTVCPSFLKPLITYLQLMFWGTLFHLKEVFFWVITLIHHGAKPTAKLMV